MSKTIWKFPLRVVDQQTVMLPVGATPLSVQVQGLGSVCLWALVDPDAPMRRVTLRTHGTGHTLDDLAGYEFVGTYQIEGGALVFHVFAPTP